MFKEASKEGIRNQVEGMIALAKERGEDRSRQWALSIILNGAISRTIMSLVICIMSFAWASLFYNTQEPALIEMVKGYQTLVAIIGISIGLFYSFLILINIWRARLTYALFKSIN